MSLSTIDKNIISDSSLNQHVIKLIEHNVFLLFTELLKKISDDYKHKNIQYEELATKYMSYFKKDFKVSTSLEIASIKDIKDIKDTKDIHIDYDVTKCSAKTGIGKQCSRKRQKDQIFCGSHLHNQPHGVLNLESIEKKNVSHIHDTNIIMASLETIDDITYVVDNNSGSIYKIPPSLLGNINDDGIDIDNLKLVGKKMGNKIQWLTETDRVFM
jgi:hypothetical protein